MNSAGNKNTEFRIKSERDFTALRGFLDAGLMPLITIPEMREAAISESMEWVIPWSLDYINVGDGTSQFSCLIERKLPGGTVRVMLTKNSAKWGRYNPLMSLMNGNPRARSFKITMAGKLPPEKSITLTVSVGE